MEHAHLPTPPGRDLHPMKQGRAGRTAWQVLPAEQKTGGLHLGGYFNRGLQDVPCTTSRGDQKGVQRTQASCLQCNGHLQRSGWMKQHLSNNIYGSSPTDASRKGNPEGDSVGKRY